MPASIGAGTLNQTPTLKLRVEIDVDSTPQTLQPPSVRPGLAGTLS